MSFTGSYRRTMNYLGGWKLLIGIPLLAVWWVAIAVWYVLFGLVMFPYRLLRRGARKRKLAEARHRELMEAARLGQS